MSLIHDAIREMDKGSNPALPGLAPALATGRPSTGSQLLPAVGGFAAVVALSAGGWWLWQTYQPMPAATVKTEITQLAATAAPALPPVAQAAPEVLVSAIVPSPVVHAVVAPAESEALASANMVAPGKAATQVRPVARPKPRVPVAVKPPVVTQSPADDMPVEKRFALFLQSMKSNDLAGAGEQLKALQVKLPAGTMSRLRAEAWFALRSGQDASARQAYRDILEQSPGDEEASVNLASIEARADRREVARQVLGNALRSNPDSQVLRHAVNRFKAPVAN